MKKEIFAAAFLIIVFALSLLNVHFLGKMTDELSKMVQSAETLAQYGQWENALKTASSAAERWETYNPYTHITVRHTEIDSTSDSFFAFIGALKAEDMAETECCALTLSKRLESIHSMERLTFGSIF